jgi:hypothetical protein
VQHSKLEALNVADGSSTAAPAKESRGSYTPNNRHEGEWSARPFGANRDILQRSKQRTFSPSAGPIPQWRK